MGIRTYFEMNNLDGYLNDYIKYLTNMALCSKVGLHFNLKLKNMISLYTSNINTKEEFLETFDNIRKFYESREEFEICSKIKNALDSYESGI